MARFRLRDGRTEKDLGQAILDAADDRAKNGPQSTNVDSVADAIREVIDDKVKVKVLYDGLNEAGEYVVHVVIPDTQNEDPNDFAKKLFAGMFLVSCSQ